MCIASDTIGSVGPVTFHPGRGLRPVPYWLAMAPDAAPGVPPLVAVHGIRRGAQQQATLFAKRAAAMGRHVIAPLFDTDTWAGYQQAFLRGRADLALLDVLADLRLRGVITSEHVDLFGFSGGAQFVHRFAMLHPQIVGTLSIASPGWYTFFDEAPYPYGLSPRAGRSDSWAPSLIANLDRFLALPMRVCIGEKDRVPDKNTRRGFEIDAQQGLHRMARAERWTEAVRTAARAMGVKPDITLHVLPGCGHDFEACMTRGEMDKIVIDAHRPPHVGGTCQGLCTAAQRRACQGASPGLAPDLMEAAQ